MLKAFLWVFLTIAILIFFSWSGFFINWRNSEFAYDSARVQSLSLPAWAPELWKDIAKKSLSQGSVRSIFDKASLTESQAKVEALPFVEKVELVSRSFPRSVRTKIQVRRPVALVHVGNKYVAVDGAGVVLPDNADDPKGGFQFTLPVVELPAGRAGQAPAWGQDWTDHSIEEACRIAHEIDPISELPAEAQIVHIDLRNLDGKLSRLESEVVLTTKAGAKIYWGRSSLKAPYGELSSEAKIQNLRIVLDGYPALQGLREIDLRFDKPTVSLLANSPVK